MATDNIKVAIRVRRLIEKELASGLKSHWTANDNSICCLENDSNGRKIPPYSFDRVFDDSTVTMDIFEEVCKPIVDSALTGFNGTIFAYGQSSSGKTFTMSGSRMQPGIISLAVDEIFTRIENIPDREFLIRVGYLEIYKEKVSDLLNTDDVSLKLQEDTDRNIQVVGLTEELVKDSDNVFKVLKKGDANRHTAETKQNDRSSRSHCILRFVIESRKAGHEDDAVNVSNLYFVDLAGSEKAGDNSGDRFREGCSINKSLFTLGMVIRKLSGDTNQQHVSFRDSKLTRILQNALGGNSKTAIICTITPAHIDESDSTLKFASRAKNITNKPTVNEVMSDAAMLKQYRLKMKKLEQQIAEMNANGISSEKVELEKQLEEKDRVERQQAEMISKLQMIVISGSCPNTQEPPLKKRRRETWCPGKAKATLPLRSIPEFSPPVQKSFATISSKPMDAPIFEEEDSFQLLENIQVPCSNNVLINQTQNADETINMNPTVKELFDLQDKHEILLNELSEKNNELKELEEFTQYEREMEADQIKQLKADLKKKEGDCEALKSSLPWLEEELMKAQQERNSLRLTVESLNAKLNSVEDGSGITQIAGKLTVSETQVSDLSSDLQIQKSQYEFHIKQMKLKLETYTAMLEEKGVDFESIKARLSVNDINESGVLLEEQNSDVSELKAKHEEEINELRTEVDMKVIALEKEKKRTDELREQFEIELEQQKGIYMKDVDEAKEEIEIYQQMLEEEKSKGNDMNDTVQNSAGPESNEKIMEIQNKYEEEILRLNLDVQKYQNLCKELEDQCKSTSNDCEQTASSLLHKDEQCEKFSKQIETMELEVKKYQDLYENAQEKLTNRRSQVLDCTVDDETVGMNVPFLNVQNEGIGMDLQKEMMQVEINKLKDNHETEVAELKAEIAQFISKLEQNQLQDSSSLQQEVKEAEINKLRDVHETEVAELKEEMAKYVSRLEQKEVLHVDNMHQEIMQVEIEKLREDHEKEVVSLKEEIAKYVSRLDKSEVPDGDNLQQEMMQVEIEKLKEDHEKEVVGLKEEIAKYVSRLENNGVSDGGNLPQEMMQVEIEKLREDHEKEVVGLKEEIAKYVSRLEKNEVLDGDNLHQEMMQVEIEKLREDHEKEVIGLKEEIAKYVLRFEHNEIQDGANLQQEIMQVEIDKLRENHESEVTDLKNEIGRYASMLEENTTMESVNLQTEVLQAEVNKLKENHETEVSKLNEEIERYKTMLEKNELNDADSQKDVMQAEIDSLRKCHENEISELREEIVKYVEKLEQNEFQHQIKSIETEEVDIISIKENHEKEVATLKEEITKFVNLLEQKNDHKETNLHVEMMQAEINKMKEIHESEVAELKQIISKYSDVSEQNEYTAGLDLQSEMLRSEIQTMKESHDSEVTALKEEIAKYVGLLEKNESRDGGNLHKDIEAEISKLKESHNLEVEELKQELAECKKVIEKNKCLEEVDLQNEIIESEIINMKQSQENEITKLQEEIANYTVLLEEKAAEIEKLENKAKDEVNMMEINEIKLQFENERQEMQSQIDILSSQFDTAKQQMGNNAKTECIVDDQQGKIDDDNDLDLELKIAEKEADLGRCHEEIGELKSKVTSYEELLQKEKEKVERILESVDERRPHQDEHNDMKMMYEEKINELEDEIKIYMDLLEEGKLKQENTNEGQKPMETEQVEAKFVEEISRLKKELEKYSRLSMCGDELVKDKSMAQSIEDHSINYIKENKGLKDQISELNQKHQIELDGMKKQFETFVEENFETKNSHEEMKKNYEELVETLRIELEDIKNQLLKLQQKHSAGVKSTLEGKKPEENEKSTEISTEFEAELSPCKSLSTTIDMVVQQVDMAKELIDVSINTSFKDNIEQSFTDDIKQLKQEIEEKEKHLMDVQQTYDDAKNVWTEEKIMSTQLVQEQEEIIQGLKDNISVLEDGKTELEDHMKVLEDEIKKTYEENTVLKSRVEELEGHIRIGKGMLESRNEEIRTLKDNIEEVREEMEMDIQEKVKEMESYVSELENKNEASEDALRIANEKVEEFEQSEAQFSDKIINLESDLDLLKEKEETLSKMCSDYEEKIVLLEADIDTMKTRTADYERLCADLEIAQSKDMDLKEVQHQYTEQIQDLVTKLKEKENQIGSLESENLKLSGNIESLSSDLESINVNLSKMREENRILEEERDELMNAQCDLEETKHQLKTSEERMELYAETLKELNEQIRLSEEETTLLQSRVLDLESENKILNEAVTETDLLKVKVESLEAEVYDKSNTVSNYESEINMLKEKLEVAENCKISASESERLQHEFEVKIKETEDKLKVVEDEKDALTTALETLKMNKEEVEKMLESTRGEKFSLEDDVLVLEKGLPLHVLKYHSQPENIDWEKKWVEFTREEKKKRLAVGCTIRGLKKELAQAQERQKNAYDEALQAVYEKEQEKDVYKKMESKIEKINEEANTMYHDLEEEKEKNRALNDKLTKLDAAGSVQTSQTNVNTMTDDHLCKFKLEAFAAKERMMEKQEEFTKRINQYESTICQYEERISHMKNQMRRLQSNMDDTMDAGSMKMPTFDTVRKQENNPTVCAATNPGANQISESNTPANQYSVVNTSINQGTTTNASVNQTAKYGSSTSGGIIDYFKVVMTEAENKEMKKELEKQKRKTSRFDDLEKENKSLKLNLDKIKKTYPHSDEIEKENISLKEELKQLKANPKTKMKETQLDVSLGNTSQSRHPLEDMFKLGSDPPPPSPRKEALFKEVCLKSQKREDTRQYQEEAPNCKTS